MSGLSIRKTILVLAASAAVTIPVSVTASAHADVTCYGDYCSGQDPTGTGCAADGQTVAWLDMSGARLELRWSPTCKTNWARWQQYPIGMKSDIPTELAAVQDTGYTQSVTFDVNGPGEGTSVTPMIYSPVHAVRAVATVQCGGMTLLDTAFDCYMNGKAQTDAR